MKKILLFFILLYPVVLFSQPASGDGSSGSPYSGVITTPWTLSGDKYCGSLSVTSGTFTISAGAILRFGTGNFLSISGTGAISAVGNSSNYITLTASGSTWGRLSFDNPSSTAASTLDFCIIEKGFVTGTGYVGAGGGILIRHSYVTVSNSTIRNNSSDWGGGIFVDANKTPYFYKCLFKENTTIHAGGGIYFYNGSGSVVENCIFDNNHVTEPTVTYYTGGGIAAQTGCSIKVLNCTFVNNTSTRTEGQSLLLHSSPNSRVINSLFWGSSNKQIYCYGTTGATIINSAYIGITYTTGTAPVNSIVLNTTNTASDGPNFNATNGSDWSIKYISPCRDAGVNTYTGVTIPTTDYISNPRVFTKDIGTYEVQYSRWTGTTSDLWTTATNWDASVAPSTGTGDVYIPSGLANYPTNDDSTPPDFIIGAGKQMIIEPGAKVTLDDLTNSGTLNLNSNSSGISSLITNTFSGNDANVQLYLTGGAINDGFRWHLISSPFMTLLKAPIWSVTNELAQWVESYNRTSLSEGWIAADGWNYATQAMGGVTFDNLDLGKGYTHYFATPQTYTLSGELNTEDKTVTIKCTYPLQPLLYGHNLLGNPFSSGLNWNAIVNGTYPDSTSKVLHYRKDAEHVYYINYVGSDVGVNGIIPPMQGFFVKAYGKTRTITLPASARVHDSIPARYKGKGPVIPLVRIDLALGDRHDNTVIRFDDAAKAGLDNDFDAVKDFISTTKQSIYSISEGVKYVINGQPFPVETADYPIAVNLLTTGNYTASVTEFQGLDNYNVYLIDNQTGFIADLKTTPVLTFTGSAGLFTDRFILRVSNVLTGTEETELSENIFNLYQGFNMINIQPMSDEWDGKSGSIRVLDLTGKTASDLQNTEFRKNSVIQVATPGARGLYVVEIRSGVRRWVGKVVIR